MVFKNDRNPLRQCLKKDRGPLKQAFRMVVENDRDSLNKALDRIPLTQALHMVFKNDKALKRIGVP